MIATQTKETTMTTTDTSPALPTDLLAEGIASDGNRWQHVSDANAIEWIEVGGTGWVCRETDEGAFADLLQCLVGSTYRVLSQL